MLAWLRKKQTGIATGMAAVFLGSLFTLFCQHCLAQMEWELEMIVASKDYDHCTHANSSEPEPALPGQPCMGVCDCGDNAMLIADNHAIAISNIRDYDDFKLLIPPAAYRSDYAPAVPAYVIGKPDKPDRACFTPLERNCVLLN